MELASPLTNFTDELVNIKHLMLTLQSAQTTQDKLLEELQVKNTNTDEDTVVMGGTGGGGDSVALERL